MLTAGLARAPPLAIASCFYEAGTNLIEPSKFSLHHTCDILLPSWLQSSLLGEISHLLLGSLVDWVIHFFPL